MASPPKISFTRLVRQVVLDLHLLHHFANHGRRQEILDVITDLRRNPADGAALDLIERHCGGTP